MGDLKPEHIERADLERERTEILRRGGWKPGLWAATRHGRSLLVKDVRDSNPLFRWCMGRWMLWHEANIYERLQECAFVPRLAGWIDGDAFVVERIQAISLGKYKRPAITPEFYDRLRKCVDDLHAMGVVHLDLRSRRNVLVTSDGTPMLIDFGNALFLGRSWLSRRVLVPMIGAIDKSAVVKFRGRDFPELLSRGQAARVRAFKLWRVLWPWGRLWRAMGVNRWLKDQTPVNTSADTPSAPAVSTAAPVQPSGPQS